MLEHTYYGKKINKYNIDANTCRVMALVVNLEHKQSMTHLHIIYNECSIDLVAYRPTWIIKTHATTWHIFLGGGQALI